MAIYDNKDTRYLYLYCQKCHYKGQIIDIIADINSVICPACGQQSIQVSNLIDADSCEGRL